VLGWVTQTLLYLAKFQPVIKNDPFELCNKFVLFSFACTILLKFHLEAEFKNFKEVEKFESIEVVNS